MGEEKENPDLITFRLAIPMASKDQKTVLSTIQQMYIQLRVMGYYVARLHTDLGENSEEDPSPSGVAQGTSTALQRRESLLSPTGVRKGRSKQ